MTDKSEIAEPRAELDKVKRQLSGTDMPSDAEVAKWKDEMHQLSEARASRAALTFYSRDQLAAMRAATSDADVQGIVRDHQNAPRGPTFDGAGNSHSARLGGGAAPINTTGWREPTPIGPPPGINHVDRLMDAADRRDRHDLIRAEAMRRAALGKR